jgi:hypothetical protein
MIDVRKAAEKIAQLGMLSFFPTEQNARAGVVALVCEMAETNDQVGWLVRRCLQLWSKWEGPAELRAVFCSKFRPRDGVDCYSQLEQFADGIPAEIESAAPRLAITGSQAPKFLPDDAVRDDFPQDVFGLLAQAARVKASRTRAPLPTQADIEAIKRQQDRRRTESSPTGEMVSA